MKKVALFLMILVSGCTHNVTQLDDSGVYSRTSTANTASITPEGRIQSSYNGIGATTSNQDDKGNYSIVPGSAGIMTFKTQGCLAAIVSPSNVTIGKATYDPNSGMISIENLQANISDPMSQQVAALQVALPVLADMSKTEALATIEKWKVAGTLAPTVADMLIKIIAGI